MPLESDSARIVSAAKRTKINRKKEGKCVLEKTRSTKVKKNKLKFRQTRLGEAGVGCLCVVVFFFRFFSLHLAQNLRTQEN